MARNSVDGNDGRDDGSHSGSKRKRLRRAAGEEESVEDTLDEEPQVPALPTLVCTTESVKLLVTLLTCLAHGKKDQRIRCDLDRHGMLFTSHSKGKSLQIKTSLGRELFETYEFHREQTLEGEHEDDDEDAEDEDDSVSFALNLNLFVECLSMFGPSALATTSLRMSYLQESASLLLVVEENGVICECAIQVLEHEGNDVGYLEFESAFENSAVVGRCIIQSEPLHEAFAELYDLPSAASVSITMFANGGNVEPTIDSTTPNIPKCLRLSATSETGSCEIDFAPTSKAFIEFFCASDDGSCTATFHVAVLQQAFRALAHSNETFLRMNGDGFLSVQHMVESGTGDKAFVDALISPEDTSIP